MVGFAREQELCLVYPSDLLLLSVGAWLRESPGFGVRLVGSLEPLRIREALGHASAAVVDATDRPHDAAAALELSVTQLGADRTAVYTSTQDDDFEVFTRSQGVPFYLGPMAPWEWAGLLAWVETAIGLPERAERADAPAWDRASVLIHHHPEDTE